MTSALKDRLRPFAQWLEGTRAFKFFQESQGDPRYIYLPFFWWLSSCLVPRRRTGIGNAKFSVQCDNTITHFRWFLFKEKEVEVREYIDNHLYSGDTFFDIGANIGVFSLYAAKRHPEVKVYAFEPEFSNLHYLKDNVIRNGLGDQIMIHGLAVSDISGLSQLHIQDFTPGAAVHSEARSEIDRTDEGYQVVWREGVAVQTLDAICRHLDHVPSAMKIDTDGNEAKILSGATEVLANPLLRSIMIEMPPDADSEETCRQILTASGFKLVWSRETTRNEIWSRAGTTD